MVFNAKSKSPGLPLISKFPKMNFDPVVGKLSVSKHDNKLLNTCFLEYISRCMIISCFYSVIEPPLMVKIYSKLRIASYHIRTLGGTAAQLCYLVNDTK